MMPDWNRNVPTGRCTAVAAAALAILLMIQPSSAQERRRTERDNAARVGSLAGPRPPATQPAQQSPTLPPATERIVQVFRLRHLDAATAQNAVMTMGGLSCTQDNRTNSVVVSALPETMERVKQLISELDVPETRPGQEIRIFALKSVDARSAARTLQETFGRAAQITPDSGAGALIVKADSATFPRLAEVLAVLDVPVAHPGETREVRVFTPKYTSAESAATALQAVLGDGCRVVAQDSTNSVIVKGTPAAIKECGDLLATLDREPAAAAESGVRIFQVANRKLDDEIRKAVELLVGDCGSVAFDEKTNSIIVKGDKAVLDTAAQTIRQLDKPVAAASPAAESAKLPSLRIRVVWLAQGLKAAEGEFPPPPKDLDGVAEELAKIGVTDLRLVAQTMIGSIGEGKFRLTAAPEFADVSNCVLRLEGDVSRSGRTAEPQIRLRLSATGTIGEAQPPTPTPRPPRPLSQVGFGDIDTTVAAPLGHAVVLGVTPTLKTTSVFVIQLLPGN